MVGKLSSLPSPPSPEVDPKGLEVMAWGMKVPEGKDYRCPPVPRVAVQRDRGSLGFPVQLPTGVRVRLPMAAGDWPAGASAQMWNTSW